MNRSQTEMSCATAVRPDAAVTVNAATAQAAAKEVHSGGLSLTTTNVPVVAFVQMNAAGRLLK